MEITNINYVFAMYYSSHHFDRGYSLIAYIQDEYDKEERQELLERLERCRCCSRHSHYKTVSHKPADPVPESLRMDQCMDQCMCHCRHWYRIIATLPDKETKHFRD